MSIKRMLQLFGFFYKLCGLPRYPALEALLVGCRSGGLPVIGQYWFAEHLCIFVKPRRSGFGFGPVPAAGKGQVANGLIFWYNYGAVATLLSFDEGLVVLVDDFGLCGRR